jgi:undecaprenyl pyrophosphate phosphatase UppP
VNPAKTIRTIASVVPSVLGGWVAQWADLFRDTLLFPPQTTDLTIKTGVAVATFLAVVVALLCSQWPRQWVLAFAIVLLCVSITALSLIIMWIEVRLTHPSSRELQEYLMQTWSTIGWVTVVTLVLTVQFATLYAMSATVKRIP